MYLIFREKLTVIKLTFDLDLGQDHLNKVTFWDNPKEYLYKFGGNQANSSQDISFLLKISHI